VILYLIANHRTMWMRCDRKAFWLLAAWLVFAGCSRPMMPKPRPAVAKKTEVQPEKRAIPKQPDHHPLAKEHTWADVWSQAAGSTVNSIPSPPNDAGDAESTSPADLQSAVPFVGGNSHGPLADVDERRAAAAGIRKLTGKHLVLFTDVSSAASVDELCRVFDLAFPQWCEQLGLDAAAHSDWQMRAYLVSDRQRFEAAELWPADLPQFLNGYTRGREFWLYNQSSDYYRRHLLLHEGVHGIMFSLQKSSGPAWYMEGLAELLATHRWAEQTLQLPYFPARPAEVPKLGRIEIVQTQFKQGQALLLSNVTALPHSAFLKNEPYAWSWAAAAFLFGHPAYRDRFRALMKQPAYGDLNEQLKRLYAADADSLAEEWQVFISELAHGYDFARTQLDLSDATAAVVPGTPAKFAVAADRGWQNTHVRLKEGVSYRLTASGRFTLAAEPKPWVSEPAGVTIRYHHGRPLGIVMGVVRSSRPGQMSSFLQPIVIGTGTTLKPEQSGTLFLRVNDFAGELADNSGAADVVISAE
jgi:hypothetical protein